jgi:uncharacterized protein (TIGR03084 family)
MVNRLDEVVGDLHDECEALDTIVARLDQAALERATPCEGWRVCDQIAHLAFFDDATTLAILDAARFADEVRAAFADMTSYEARYIERGRALDQHGLLAWWRAARRTLLETLGSVDPRRRVPWYGVTMSAVSVATARLMETWSHGQDIVDALALQRPATDRLRHVAFLGARTRAYAYAARGLTPPPEPVRIELVLPSGARWTDGDEQAANRVAGLAVDFCLVVTQRRHVLDTALHVQGTAAEAWMRIAQAFAGPPGSGRIAGQFTRR